MSCVLIFYLQLGLKGVENLCLFLQDTNLSAMGKKGRVSPQGSQYLCAFSFSVYFNPV